MSSAYDLAVRWTHPFALKSPSWSWSHKNWTWLNNDSNSEDTCTVKHTGLPGWWSQLAYSAKVIAVSMQNSMLTLMMMRPWPSLPFPFYGIGDSSPGSVPSVLKLLPTQPFPTERQSDLTSLSLVSNGSFGGHQRGLSREIWLKGRHG